MKKEECGILDYVKIQFETPNGFEYKNGTIIELLDTKAVVEFQDFNITMLVEYDRLNTINSKFF